MSAEAEKVRSRRKELVGHVLSDSMEKTIVVQAERRVRHRLYGKEIRKIKKYHVHDEREQSQVGDKVRIAETRPLSKTKRWRLVEILKH